MSLPTIFSLIQSPACLEMCKNWPTNQRLGNAGNSVEREQDTKRTTAPSANQDQKMEILAECGHIIQ